MGRRYEQLLPFVAPGDRKAFVVVAADFVTLDSGSGIVHMAPAFGEDDFTACQKNGIDVVDPVDAEGNFTNEVPPYAGKNVKEADKQIMADLQHLETQIARHQFDVLTHEIRDRETATEQLRTDIETSSAAVLRAEDEILQLRSRLTELEHEISGAQQRGTELKAQAEREENRIQFHEERLRELDQHHGEAVRVVERPRHAIPRHAQPVVEAVLAPRHRAVEHAAGMHFRQPGHGAPGRRVQHFDALRVGHYRAHP